MERSAVEGPAGGAVHWRHGNGAEWKRLELAESGPKDSRCVVAELGVKARRHENRSRRILLRLVGGRGRYQGDRTRAAPLARKAWMFFNSRPRASSSENNRIKALTLDVGGDILGGK